MRSSSAAFSRVCLHRRASAGRRHRSGSIRPPGSGGEGSPCCAAPVVPRNPAGISLGRSRSPRVEDFHHFEEERVSFCQPGEVEEAMDTDVGWCLRDEEQANGIRQVPIAGLGKALERIHLARVSQLRGTCSHASMSTCFPRNRTPSIMSRKRCSAAASPRNLISPPAPTIRCQGR